MYESPQHRNREGCTQEMLGKFPGEKWKNLKFFFRSLTGGSAAAAADVDGTGDAGFVMVDEGTFLGLRRTSWE